jgi:hypothetical protein
METSPRSDGQETPSAGMSCGILPLERFFGKAWQGQQSVILSARDELLFLYMKKNI